ncbi:MAG TPA: peptidyl-prolyl cis-trans isomerase [Gemmatimonadaceae bacterium]|nr:peptidyl-prolyl cis-trans isomerase [Gemmatimonadaceae bacterium]
MRSSAKYIWIFVTVAFIGGFLLYESSGLFGSAPITSTTPIATVNGQDILVTTWQALAAQLEQQRTASTGESVSLDERQAIQDQAYDQLVSDALLSQEMRRRGITVSVDELTNAAKYSPPPQLMQDPELQTNGQFDLEKYQRFLASPTAKQSGLLLQLENYYRDAIPKQKLYQQITSGLWISDATLWMNYRDAHDSAAISYAAFVPSDADVAATPVSDAEIRSYYDAHKKDMSRVGHARVTFTEIPRTITAADSAAVRNHAIALRDSIVSGALKFEDAAKAESVDSASAVRGGDLGKGVKGRFVPAFETAAAALKPGEISPPVLTQFGYHLIRLDSRNGDTLAMHHILLRIAQSDSDADRTDRRADTLAKMAASAETPDKFDAAVKALGLKAHTADVTEGQPLVYDGQQIPSVSAWAFGGAKVGESSDLYDDDAGYYLARLDTLTPGGTPSLDAAKRDIKLLLARKKAVQKEVDPARKFAIAASASSLAQAGKLLNTQVVQTDAFTRVSGIPDAPNASRIVGAAFALPVGTVSEPIVTDNAVFVIEVNRRVDADRKTFDAAKDQLRGQYLNSMQQARIQEFVANLKSAAKITDRRKEVEASMRRTSS